MQPRCSVRLGEFEPVASRIISPHISPYLAISPPISARLGEFEPVASRIVLRVHRDERRHACSQPEGREETPSTRRAYTADERAGAPNPRLYSSRTSVPGHFGATMMTVRSGRTRIP